MKQLSLLILILTLAACGSANQKSPPAPAPTPNLSADEWQQYTISDLNLTFAYPAGWYVHDGLKTVQITPNSQPVWSSFADPDQPSDGPNFDLLTNLNRQVGQTPLEEVQNILGAYKGQIETIEPAAPLSSHPDRVLGTYRFTVDDDSKALLIGAAPNPFAGSPQAVIALVALVDLEEIETMRPIFETILGSLQQAGPVSSANVE